MSTVTLEEAKSKLDELVGRLPQEGEIVITDGAKPVARLSAPVGMGQGPHSLLDIPAISLGNSVKPFPHPDDDLLEEMLEDKLDKILPRRDS
jgi:antitoxin (DNA-binding transcriptional repressor) of toxin-antitoxin stability system